MTTPVQPSPTNVPGLIARLVVLCVLCSVAFWSEIVWTTRFALRDIEAAHTLAMPLLVALLLHRRRRLLVESLDHGSTWGLVGIIAALAMLAIFTWPFDIGLPRRVAFVPALAGCILAGGGWRLLARCWPALLLLLVAIPQGPRSYAALTIKPEHYTLTAVQATLDLLPGVMVERWSLDLFFTHGDRAGAIALGEYHKGASLLCAYLMLLVFVAYARVRPAWQLIVLAVLAGPIVLLCNYLRLLIWGLVAIYGGVDQTSPVPRVISLAGSLLVAYGLAVLAVQLSSRLIVDEPSKPGEAESDAPSGTAPGAYP